MAENGDVVSILSANRHPSVDARPSYDHKLFKPTVPEVPPVTVAVDAFGTITTTIATKVAPNSEEADGNDGGEADELEANEDEYEGGGEEGGETRSPRRTQTETQIVQRYTFSNRNRMSVQVITYGAAITQMRVPDRHGNPVDVVMGFDTLQGYLDSNNPQFGATIGRCCNRITDGRFCVNGTTFQLSQNDKGGRHHSNGGWQGFDKFLWTPHLNKTVLTLTHVSEFGAEGYPGSVMARVTFELRHDNTFHVQYGASSSWPTPVNLCQQLFFNLAGHGAGAAELYRHVVTLNADRVVCVDAERLPTGRMQCVGGTVNDLRVPHELGPAISRCADGGYDEYMCLIQGTEQEMTFAGRVVHPGSGRVLEVYTDQPGVQFYTGNRLPDPYDDINPTEVYTQDYFEIPSATTGRLSSATRSANDATRKRKAVDDLCSVSDASILEGVTDLDGIAPMLEVDECDEEEEQSCHCTESGQCTCSDLEEPIVGKGGALYLRHGAFCINTQKYPDAVNVTNFPDVLLYPGQMYKHEIVYKFGLFMGGYKKPVPQLDELDEEGLEETEGGVE